MIFFALLLLHPVWTKCFDVRRKEGPRWGRIGPCPPHSLLVPMHPYEI